MTTYFSDALLGLARPHLGWVAEQLDLFDSQVPQGAVQTDLAAERARRGDRDLHVALLGSYAEDGTWLWSWANPGFEGTPVAASAARLRDLGASGNVPELVEGMVDLNAFPDPRLASDHLALIAMGLLGARGLIVFNHAGRARTFLVTDDPGVPAAVPGGPRLEGYLRTGAALVPGPESDAGLGYADTVIQGYAAHHGTEAVPVADGFTIALPGGGTVRVGVDGRRRLGAVTVTPAEGGAPVRADGVPAEPDVDFARLQASLFPDRLLKVVAPLVASAVDRDHAVREYLAEATGADVPTPVWDPAGLLRYGDGPALAAREIGVHDPAAGVWEWPAPDAGSEGAGLLRESARRNGAEEIAADRVALDGYLRPSHLAEILARTAVALDAGARGMVEIPLEGDRRGYLAVTDPRVPETAYSPDLACAAVEGAANLLHAVVAEPGRYAVMRAMVLGYFSARGLSALYVREPESLSGLRGLFEVQVRFSRDGSVRDAGYGPVGAFAQP